MTRDHLLVIDQGTTSTRAVVYNSRLQSGRPRSGRGPADLPAIGLGRARSRCPAPLGRAAGDRAARRGSGGGSDRGHRPDQPAGDDDRLGAGHGRADRAGAGLAGPPDGRRLRAAQAHQADGSPSGPGWSSTPISPRPRSPGFSTTSPTLATAPRPASWPRGRSTASWSGT